MIRLAIALLCSIGSLAHAESSTKSPEASASTDDSDNADRLGKRTFQYSLIGMDRREYLFGGITSTVFGFGTGHAVQGRYLRDGWIYTAGEVLSSAAVIASIAPCKDDFFKIGNTSISERLAKCNKAGLILGQLSFISFRVWETVDAWVTPNPDLKEHLFGRSRPRQTIELGYLPPLDHGFGSLSFAYLF